MLLLACLRKLLLGMNWSALVGGAIPLREQPRDRRVALQRLVFQKVGRSAKNSKGRLAIRMIAIGSLPRQRKLVGCMPSGVPRSTGAVREEGSPMGTRGNVKDCPNTVLFGQLCHGTREACHTSHRCTLSATPHQPTRTLHHKNHAPQVTIERLNKRRAFAPNNTDLMAASP